MKYFYSIIIIISIILILFSIFFIGLSNLAGKALLAVAAGFLANAILNVFLLYRKNKKI